ncbi:hypothetical protein GQ54DRAFT_87049 [Martensiomyces pterosporus]|nr:hypothetical protein GQ54DRAFT_87049 [Martensiomyces pterosporus]
MRAALHTLTLIAAATPALAAGFNNTCVEEPVCNVESAICTFEQGGCDNGLLCAYYTCLKDNGGSCQSEEECAPQGDFGSICLDSKCAIKGEVGTPCQSHTDCFDNCINKVCARVVRGATGSSCTSNVQCDGFCNTNTNKCEGITRSSGCTNDTDCRSGICWCGACCGGTVTECEKNNGSCI